MALVDLVMPKLGESIMEATILKWLKKPGDIVTAEEVVLEIATDKVDSEVPSTASGVIKELFFKENDVVAIGAVLATIETEATENSSSPAPSVAPKATETPVEKVAEKAIEVPYVPAAANAPKPENNGVRFYSPLVLKIAQEEGISMSELEHIPGTGQDGRVSKKDILAYLEDKKAGKITAQVVAAPAPAATNTKVEEASKPTTAAAPSAPAIKATGNVEIIEMDRMRKLISKHMTDSINTSAHVTSFAEADVTTMVKWREKVKKDFERKENQKLTFTPLFVEAIIKCIKNFPWLNSSVDGDKIIIKKDINIGMATALPSGNLIVPVIKNANQLNLAGLSSQVNSLANKARQNKLSPADTQDGTFTLTNVGTFGSLMGTPIINQPQVAILAVGAIKKRPVVIETEFGDTIAIRHMMYLSLSYDHRIIDGSLGSNFLNAIVQELEAFDINRSI
ncbi:dihydrolipoamide acetyltransferase family protein [Polluticaenibacter yanchengensis]|uniref:Dihydrolipoamide acetyltransferase component of pyruvate dehydrogenase complex n=1 Tax=Polluticaenibacter yanchengensis TaxID=3014562 RepID=A0ABT4UMF9_9BACT|nr:dihydrolipoamide acetyltransferase family protein [Chitinophagaceae bacterium LY-5]